MGLFGKSAAEKALEETQRQQAAAADPAASAWVSANAGTGKTHVLTNRLLRLLLAGTAPERILALTYTKAAAAEMSKRVFEKLARWVTAAESALKDELAGLLGRKPTGDETRRARQLFAVAIETPGGLKVQTIHAFCERLLQRFPLEAGVPPGFTILDDHQRAELLREAVDEMLADAADDRDGPQWKALQTAITFAADDSFDRVLPEVFKHCDGGRLDEAALQAAERHLRTACGVRDGATVESLNAELAECVSDAMLPILAEALRSGGKTDIARAGELQLAVNSGRRRDKIDACRSFLLTQENQPRGRVMTNAVSAAYPDIASRIPQIQQRFATLYGESLAVTLVEATSALLRLGADVLQRYTAAKARSAALDFDDLVARSAALLQSSAAVEWVLCKLDGGIDHILVDEAQDTSPVQWRVVQALAEDFFSGRGAHDDVVRTLFAVGDEKQSIYAFQGAAPHMFRGAGDDFAKRAAAAHLTLRRIPLTLSFRTVAPLLEAVDRVFADPVRTPGVTVAGEALRHASHRSGQAGLIELWPAEAWENTQPVGPWAPLDEVSSTPPVKRLASRIAGEIDRWLKSREPLASENRPIRPGDILILVRKRVPFANAMVTALKTRGIPVAGADRLVLVDQIAVQDLMALGDVLCLPDDDLAFASLLKSPLIGLDDDDLTALAPGRHGSLWQALADRAGDNPRWRAALARLSAWEEQAGRRAPFEFYAGLLQDGGRTRMLARLGSEAADAIDEFLNLALKYETETSPSLQGFLTWVRDGQRDVKRDMDQGRDEVRVMTVHGAKGLEAPIVFLPDTCSSASARPAGSLLPLAGPATAHGAPAPFLWPVKGTSGLPAVQAAKQLVKAGEDEERNRLLYVALTRARDRLYIGGFMGKSNKLPADCWYAIIKDQLADVLTEVELPDGRKVWRRESAQSAVHEKPRHETDTSGAAPPLPAWATAPAPAEPLLAVPLAPSRLASLESEAAEETAAGKGGARKSRKRRPVEQAVLPPTALAEDYRFLRGTLTHALLEHLPALSRDRRAAVANELLASRGRELPAAMRAGIVAEALAVLDNPQFARLFGPDSRAEVPIAAEIANPNGGAPLRLAGTIDRLVQGADGIEIVDYKTNRPPPHDVADVAEAYLLQLAAYRLAVGRIFPGARVRAAILWTDGARIMEIPEQILDSAQQRLWQLDPASLDA